MSDYKIGDTDGDWTLRDRKGLLELWKNNKHPPSKLGGIAGKGMNETTPPCDSSPQQAGGYSRWNFYKSGNFGVYLYENEGRGEYWLLHAIRGSEDSAREVFNTVSAILE